MMKKKILPVVVFVLINVTINEVAIRVAYRYQF
jgi:hypothetical protein